MPCGKALQAMAALPCFKFAFRAEGRSELSCAKNPDTPEPFAPPQRPIPPPPNLLSRLRGFIGSKVHTDVQLFPWMARAIKLRVSDFEAQVLANRT